MSTKYLNKEEVIMAAEVLKDNINRILKERGWKLQDLERKAGTNRTIYNIMRESSNNPSLDLLEKIAKALNVDYKELINDHSNVQYINDYSLLLEACSKVIAELKLLPENLKISFDAVCILILEVYSYADQFKNDTIDPQFVKWSVMKYYSIDQSNTN